MAGINCSVPNWLKAMRAITGTQEDTSNGDNPRIMGMRDWIACQYQDVDGMMEYCALYTGDDVAWCGLTAGWCCTVSGHMPPFVKGDDTACFFWAQSFANDPGFRHLESPVIGTIVVMTRSGGGHVTMFEGWTDSSHRSFKARGGNQSDEVNVSTYDVEDVIAWVWPKDAPLPIPGPEPQPEPEHETIELGDTGSDVADCQRILGLPVDGDFGGQTEAGVEAFQRAMDLDVDGCVGAMTWTELEALDGRVAAGDDGLEAGLIADIIAIAEDSELADYSWNDRGRAPPGYIPGMALCFALAVKQFGEGNSAVKVMAQADRNQPSSDALSAYASQFRALGMNNSKAGVDTLRHLWVMIIGLGMCESSGNHWCGRDTSVPPGYYGPPETTTEAGLFQSSWDLAPASPEIPKLFEAYWTDPNGFRPTFSEGLSPKQADLEVCGAGGAEGVRYQWLAKFCPGFAAAMTAVGMRTRGGEDGHWGPIRREEVELRPEADELLREVQELVAPSA